MGDGRDQEPAANEARRSARSVAPTDLPPSPAPTHVPDGFPPGSQQVPAVAHVSATGIRVPWGGSRSPRHEQELKRDRMGTESEPQYLRIEPNGDWWGLGPFTIEQTTEEVTAIHSLAASRLRGRRLSRHRPPARSTSGIRGKAGATVGDDSRTSDQDGPEPGHLIAEARSERTEAGGALGRRANGTGAPARAADHRGGCHVPDGRRRAWPTT
jgi:hypothetical protein